ncbi:MAG: bifunctional diguanylate cyclase/phosphodiesterase [Terracidiphilus sp.]|jgi:EAL domain-containing protein (putative c-di-GMP-specific phosphodiesterase class I)/GGDEF domain-containing protein
MTAAGSPIPKVRLTSTEGKGSFGPQKPPVLPFHRTVEPLHRTIKPRYKPGASIEKGADREFTKEILDMLFCDNCMLKHSEADDDLRRQMAAYGLRRDIQTGLMNYQSFQEALADLLRDGPPGQEIALIWIDLLNLRREFSLRGFNGSETLVRHVASGLRSVVDRDELLCRFSGRCFLIGIRAQKWDKNGKRRIQAIAEALSRLGENGPEEKPEIAAGVAFYPADTNSAEELVRFASLAATRAGSVNTPRPFVMNFHCGMNNLIMREYKLELEMRNGLDRGEFSIAYQPKIDLVTGDVLGAEALIRWNHPDLGSVAASEFIPIAERCGLIHRIFDFTLRSTLDETRQWSRQGLFVPIVSVNISAIDLRREDFARTVRGILAEAPIAPVQLELEVTESVLFDDEELFTKRVRQLREIGVRISIDDFGTRYTGFNVLLRLPLTAMKIDKCFVGGIDRSQDMRALCQTIVAMARQLKMHSVAEGIEEPGELRTLQEIGCQAGQGYLFQRPVHSAEFASFLRDWPGRKGILGFAVSEEMETFEPLQGIA